MEVVWFRDDLRTKDNTALYHAAKPKSGVVGIYIFCAQDLAEYHTAPCRIAFILRNLEALQAELADRNIPLVIKRVEKRSAIPKVLVEFCKTLGAHSLRFNIQYPINERRRDKAVGQALLAAELTVHLYNDALITKPAEVLTQAGDFYTVFTPFKKRWLTVVAEQLPIKPYPLPTKQPKGSIHSSPVPNSFQGVSKEYMADRWEAGEAWAHKHLRAFTQTRINDYKQDRDFPAVPGTSQLSHYLANGVLSPRQCLAAALKANQDRLTSGKTGALTWISELIWREFYAHIAWGFPRVCMNQSFRDLAIPWRRSQKDFTAWCEGNTGFPIVDAAMRQLNRTGWMHNRLRMIVAMFLVKDLRLDWRWGEQYFMEHLIDGEFCANNGGWQWAAGTGTDAAPYFRVFNPVTQSERFDPSGDFIRQYCPELASLSSKHIHWPDDKTRKALGYALPIVDHKKAREEFLALLKK